MDGRQRSLGRMNTAPGNGVSVRVFVKSCDQFPQLFDSLGHSFLGFFLVVNFAAISSSWGSVADFTSAGFFFIIRFTVPSNGS